MNRHITLGLAIVAGAALGAAAVQSLHAQAKPVAYVVSEITVTNQDAYDKEYVPPVVKSIQDGGGKFIARAGKTPIGEKYATFRTYAVEGLSP
jgi:hypothetical protein